MPIYEYKCLDCNHRFEQLVSITANETVKCPSCQSVKVQKTISASSYRLASSSSGSIPSGALSGCASRSGFS